MEKPLISIIVPVYNVEPYLAECIDSLVNQTYPHLEILLVDDGSTDGSGQICDDYAQKDARIKVIHKKNGGNTSARKAGLRVATGAYVQFVDSDDWVEPDMCESLMALAQEHGADVVRCGYWKESGEKSVRQCDDMPKGKYSASEDLHFLRENMIFLQGTGQAGMQGYLFMQLTTKVLMSNVLLHEPDEIQYAEDMACVFLCVLQAKCVYFSEKAGYHYRQRNDSITHSDNPKCYAHLNAWYLFLYERFAGYPETEKLRNNLKRLMDRMILMGLNQRFFTNRPIVVPLYYFKMNQVPVGARIVLYGAGNVGQSYHKLIELTACYTISAWVDQNYQKYQELAFPVQAVETVQDCEYDCVIVAVLKERLYLSIRKSLCEKYGVEPQKVVWLPPTRAERDG